MDYINTIMHKNGIPVTSGYYFLYNDDTECYFRPDDGRWDFKLNGTVYYGFASCTKNSSVITITYLGGTPFLPKFFFSDGVGSGASIYSGHDANGDLIPYSYTKITSFYFVSIEDILKVSNVSVFIPAFKVTTLTEAATIGGLGTNSTKSITKSDFAEYNIKLKDYYYVISPEYYTSHRVILKDDIEISNQIPDISLYYDINLTVYYPGFNKYPTGNNIPVLGSHASYGGGTHPSGSYYNNYIMDSSQLFHTSLSYALIELNIAYNGDDTQYTIDVGDTRSYSTSYESGSNITIDCSDYGLYNETYDVVFQYGTINGIEFLDLTKVISNADEDLNIELYYAFVTR